MCKNRVIKNVWLLFVVNVSVVVVKARTASYATTNAHIDRAVSDQTVITESGDY